MVDNDSSHLLSYTLSNLLNKPSHDFQRADFLKVIEQKKTERITFHYTAVDGRLKELKFPVLGPNQVELLLAEGERVDGSSLFKGIISTEYSDLYVVPEYKTAFFNPFDESSLDFICRFVTKGGTLAPFTMDNILRRACELFRKNTGLELYALGELEFFLISEKDSNTYPLQNQPAYHESSPFVKSTGILDEIVHRIARIAGAVKYAHSEVGHVESIESARDEIKGRRAEQLEIEFLPCPADEMADALVIGKWLIRNVAYRHDALATFMPKIEEGVPGNGLHFHLELKRDGKNVMVDSKGNLSVPARCLISGLCEHADSLTGFGNTVPSSYLRLVPNLEAPTHIFWSELDRSAMIRVPLGWTNTGNLARMINPQEKRPFQNSEARQTVELRSPDGSAHIHLLLAGITMAAEWGMNNKNSTELAEKYHSGGKRIKEKKRLESFPLLPSSCVESGRMLLKKREFYERDGIFPPTVIDYVAQLLQAENDDELMQKIAKLPKKDRLYELRKLMHKDLYLH